MRALPLRCATTLALLASVANAQPSPVRVVPERSEIAFAGRQMGAPVQGRFARFQARLALDLQHPEGGSVALDIDTASAGLGVPLIDAELAKPAWFDAARFPHATFQSSAIRSLGAGHYEVAGRLSLKGHSRDVVVPVALAPAAGLTVAIGEFPLKRLDFGIGEGEWGDPSLVADEVRVTFKLVLQ